MAVRDPEAVAKQVRRTRQQRLWRRAKSRGLVLSRSRRRTASAPDFGRYALTTPENTPKQDSGPEYTLTLDEVEAMLPRVPPTT